MELDIIKLRTTWNDAAGSINSNYAKIADAIAQLKANGGGGGISELTSKMVVDALGYTPYNATNPANYITSDALSPYAKTADVSTTYATIASIQGFENRIGGLEGAVPQLNERVTTVEGKVSSLNETVSTGENNLLDRVNTIETEYVTSGNLESAINGIDLSAYLLKADLTKSRIQSTLGISDWALAATKPSYTAAEVGALAVGGTAVNSDKLNGLSKSDFVRSYGDVGANYSKGNWAGYSYATEAHGGSTAGGVISAGNEEWGFQLNGGAFNDGVYYRAYSDGTFNTWRKLAFTSDIPTKLSQLTDDVVAGKYLPLSKFQVAEVADPSKVYLQSGIYRQSEGSHLALGTSGWSQFITLHAGGDNWAQMYFSYDGRLHYRAATFADGTPENIHWTEIITEKNIGDYNAGSATKLQTPRTLWGQSFDGTADVSGNLYSDIWRIVKDSGTGGVFFQAASYNALSDLGIVYISALNGNDLLQCNIWATKIFLKGNVGIGTTSPTEKLDVAGNIKASGNINATSVTIGGVTLSWDSVNNALVVNGNMYGTGSITAKKSA